MKSLFIRRLQNFMITLYKSLLFTNYPGAYFRNFTVWYDSSSLLLSEICNTPVGVIQDEYSSEWQRIFRFSHSRPNNQSFEPKFSLGLFRSILLWEFSHFKSRRKLLSFRPKKFPVREFEKSVMRCNLKVTSHTAFLKLSDWKLLGMKWERLHLHRYVFPFGLHNAPFIVYPSTLWKDCPSP